MNETFKHKIKTTALILLSTILVAACAAFGLSYLSADGNTQTASAATYDTELVDAWNTAVSSSSTASASTFTLTKNWVADVSGFGEGDGFSSYYGGCLYVPSGKTVILDLNGYTIDRNLSTVTTWGTVIEVEGSLTIRDNSSAKTGLICGGYNKNYGGGIVVSNGRLVIYSGTISNNRASVGGGGVYLVNESTFIMYGGTISGNSSTSGGAVYVNNRASFTMSGGTISGALYVSSGGNYDYVSGTVSSVTIAKTTLTDTTQNVSLTYDGAAHGITVSATGFKTGDSLANGYIKYGTSSGSYTLTSSPTYTNAGTYTVYYQVTFTDTYYTLTGNKTVTIEKATLTDTSTGYSGTYDGAAHKITVSATGFKGSDNLASKGTINYGTSSGNCTLTLNPTYTNAGTYTVYYQVTFTNYNTITGSKTVTINKATLTDTSYSATHQYDGDSYGISVSATGFKGSDTFANTATVKYGTSSGTYDLDKSPTVTNYADGLITVYYQITFVNYETITGSQRVGISQADLTEIANVSDIEAQVYTGAEAKPPITVNNTYIAAASKVLTPDRDYTATYSNNVNAGTATITITGVGNFKGTITKTFSIVKAALTDTTEDVNVDYDGEAHGITVSATGFKGSDTFADTATVKYGTEEGSYNSDACPTLTEAGTLTVYYRVTFVNYDTITGSATVTVDPEEPEEPDVPVEPEEPEEPEEPDVPVDPEEPEEPDVPVDPEEPEEPVDPDEPEEPNEPDVPVEPENPDQTGGEDNGESGKPDAGNKVHPAAIAVPVAVVVVGAVAASAVVLFKKRKK